MTPKEAISQAIDADQVFTDTDGYKSIRLRSPDKLADIALKALADNGFHVHRMIWNRRLRRP